MCMLRHFSHVCLFRDPVDCSLPGSSVHGILQARILGRFAFICTVSCTVLSIEAKSW